MFHTPRMPAGIEIRLFDPLTASRREWAQLHAYRRTRHQEDHPGEQLPPEADFEHELMQRHPLFEARRLMVVRDGVYVGNLLLGFRRDGSLGCEDHAAFVDAGGGVLGGLRRLGIGTALLAALHAFMQDSGRTVATLKIHRPEGHAFMSAIGARKRYSSVENRLAMEGLNWVELAQWQAHVAASANGLRWETHAGRVPFDRLAGLMEPLSVLINEQPLGSLEIPRIRYELQGYESWYAAMDRRGGDHFLVMLLHGDDVAAVCDASWDARFADRVYQQLTAVARAWRGKGLAKGVKAAMFDLVRRLHPDVRTVVTNNANTNVAMLSINQRLGFTMHRQDATYQISVDALRRRLSAPQQTSGDL
ncbi:N-acetyltransferase [Polaromonas sp.]|uniref:N-acetyltransferase n=1 Tax=Polaromonas sp. TaxID=1869339 RepID=UPI003264AB37